MTKVYVALCTLSLIGFSACTKKDPLIGEPHRTGHLSPRWASTVKQPRNVVLEYFQGVRTPYSASADQIVEELEGRYGDRVLPIAIHAGTFAAPLSGWANFTCRYGAEILSQAEPSGFPFGTVNRSIFLGKGMNGNLSMAMSRQDWESTFSGLHRDTSYVNIGGEAIIDLSQEKMSVTVELYYTDNNYFDNYINIALLQDGLKALLTGQNTGYVHNHVLRDLLTGQWGVEVPADTMRKGNVYRQTFHYPIPRNYNGALIPPGGGPTVYEDLDLVVFVSRKQTNIITGIRLPIRIE
ncbi:MAG: Omp28-related outer membrane protein [Bacteroidia bacterium]|nr:Omp28-related outer membrane protein [Bacteroidia bacterium]